jgi:type 1 fimbriae regulatory protein FimB/type 1 fimbriae regulatory protein FimE
MRQAAGLRLVTNDRQMLQTGQSDDPARSAPPARRTNTEMRGREHLSRDEIDVLVKVARRNRHGARDAAAVWLGFNHGLRIGELVDMRWGDVRWEERVIYVRRLKGSQSGEHPLTEADKRAIGPLRSKGRRPGDTVFAITAIGFRKMMSRLALPEELAGLAVHPHMLRHSCGYDMYQRTRDIHLIARYLGHKRVENAVRYSHLDASCFEGVRD